MGAEQSVLSQALADLRRIEDGARKAAKKGKKDGASMCFEDGVWQAAVSRFVDAVPVWAEVWLPPAAPCSGWRRIHCPLHTCAAVRVCVWPGRGGCAPLHL